MLARPDCSPNAGCRRPVREVPGSLDHDRGWQTPLASVGELDVEFRDLLAQGIAVDAEHRGRPDLVAMRAIEYDFEKRSFDSLLDSLVDMGRLAL